MELLSVTMNDGVKMRSDIEGKDNSSEDKSNYKIVRTGDMVYNSMRMWQGANGISPWDGIVSPAYTVLKPRIPLSNGFFSALFKTHRLINEFRKNSQGMTSDTWNLKYPQIETIKTCIPVLDEQEKIAEFLMALDQRIEKQRTLVEHLKKYKRGVLEQFIATFQSNNASFVSLKEITQIYDGTHQTPNYQTHGVKFVSVENIESLLDTRKYISKEDFEKEFKISPSKGDVLMTRIGDIGRSSYVDFDTPIAFYVSLALFKCKNQLDGRYLAHYIMSNAFQEQLWKRTLHIAFPKKINTCEIGECEILLPSLDDQRHCAKLLDSIDLLINKNQKILEYLTTQRLGILQQIFI